MEDNGVFLQVVDVALRYLRSTTFDDEVEIHIRTVERKRVSMTIGYEVWLLPERTLCVTGTTTLACVDASSKLRRLPEGL